MGAERAEGKLQGHDEAPPLATWHLKRLGRLSAGPRLYGRWDTVNAYLVARGLIAVTEHGAGLHKREYATTEAGQVASEVKALASQTARAMGEISAQIA